MSDIVSYLFKTNSIKFCPENKPFWLTSGKIAPYFVNTQFLYGSEMEAQEFLNYITNELTLIEKGTNSILDLPKKIFDKVLNQYNTNEIYKNTINQLKEYIVNNIGIDNFEYISGGERRDWFFSNILSYLLKKPHITLFKNLTSEVSSYNFENTKKVDSINNAKVLHIADLITTASSYPKSWIPGLKNIDGNMVYSLVVIDRNQGGKQNLKDLGVESHSIVTIDKDIFQKALDFGIISDEQLQMLLKFFDNPDDTMREFLKNHPEFIEESLQSTNERTLKRVHQMIDGNLYGLN